MIALRSATLEDQQAILDIYNEAVTNTTATFDTEHRSYEKQLNWFTCLYPNFSWMWILDSFPSEIRDSTV